MSQVPTPPASRSGSEPPATAKPAEAPSELLQSLDALLEQYLHLLDRQQELQSGLAKELSSGFLALAHANYTSPPGRRYGADYYDERMKAIRKISIRSGHDEERLKDKEEPKNTTALQVRQANNTYKFVLETPSEDSSKPEAKDTAEKDIQKPAPAIEQLQTEEPAPQTNGEDVKESSTAETGNETESPKKSSPAKKKFHSDDPIHWYGILVPASLRNAQRSFTEGVQSQVPELAGVVVQMRALEEKIAELRIQIESEVGGE